jgi:hypothetical protein
MMINRQTAKGITWEMKYEMRGFLCNLKSFILECIQAKFWKIYWVENAYCSAHACWSILTSKQVGQQHGMAVGWNSIGEHVVLHISHKQYLLTATGCFFQESGCMKRHSPLGQIAKV